MKHLRTLPILLAAALSSPAFAEKWPHAVTYEIFVRSFADSNGDGIGDLQGVTEKLDYLKDLGVQAIWLMPIHPSPSYHKYDVTDYRDIHPEYGTMKDFETFVAEAHRRGIRVVIDLVINHTARQHPWFEAAVQDPSGPYRDYYVWRRADEIDSMTVQSAGPDTDNLRRWHETGKRTDDFYYAYFTGGMPDLNFDNPEVRREIYDIGRFWLEKGVDGFRLDAAMHIYPDDREDDSVAFWKEFRREMEKTKPDVLLVGEVWTDGDRVKKYLPGLKSVFNFELAGSILDAVRSGQGRGLAARHADLQRKYNSVTSDFVDATFLSNHDQNRVMSVLDDEDKARVAAAILLTLPGSPYIYYGEEIGMLGMKPDHFIREPMLWQKQPDPSRVQSGRVRYNKSSAVRPAQQQLENPSSLLNHYRSLIHLRNETAALNRGELMPVEDLHDSLVAFVRKHGNDHVFVAHNVSGKKVVIELPEILKGFTGVLWKSSDRVTTKGATITLPAHSSIVLQPPTAP